MLSQISPSAKLNLQMNSNQLLIDKNMERVIKIFNYQFYLKELLVIIFTFLLMENIFSWLVMPDSVITLAYQKSLSILIFLFVIYKYNSLQIVEKIIVGLFTLLMVKLVFESIYGYGVFFEQFTMFTILFPVIFGVYIKCICRSLELDFLEFLAKFYLYTYLIFMVVYGRQFSFSLESIDMVDYGPFSGDSRIIHAQSIFMMIVPLLWYLNKFLKEINLRNLIPFLFCFTVILIHQHRSVWASAIISILIYFFSNTRNSYISPSRLLKISLSTLCVFIVVWFVLASTIPSLTNLLIERFSEILDPTRADGTGKFREDQREVYYLLFLQKPVFGWSFAGFEMPNPLVDWWPDKSGQHFHEGYVEVLFYQGILGFLLKYSVLFYLSVKTFSKKLSEESIILIAFCVAGLVFSFSYVLPLIFWGVVGVCLYYLEKEPEAIKPPSEEDDLIEEQNLKSVFSKPKTKKELIFN